MAKDKKDKFELNKGADRGFDISKGGKRKFDLKKDDDEAPASTPTVPIGRPTEPVAKPTPTAPAEKPKPTPTAPLPAESPTAPIDPLPEPAEKKGGKKWMGIAAAAVIIIALLAWWLWPSTSKTDPAAAEQPAAEQLAQNQDQDQPALEADHAQTAEEQQAEEQPAEEQQAEEQPAEEQQAAPAPSPANATGDVVTEAYNVIRGDYGVGQERKDKLGARYAEIQAKVNELMRSL